MLSLKMSLVLQIPPHILEWLRLCASITKGMGLISGFGNKNPHAVRVKPKDKHIKAYHSLCTVSSARSFIALVDLFLFGLLPFLYYTSWQ